MRSSSEKQNNLLDAKEKSRWSQQFIFLHSLFKTREFSSQYIYGIIRDTKLKVFLIAAKCRLSITYFVLGLQT